MTPDRIRFHLQRSLFWVIPGLIYLYAVGQASHGDGKDLWPAPDAQEYALLANRLAHFELPLIPIGLHDYPSRYSLAYPLLLTPFAWLFRFDITHYLWASAFFGLLAVVLIARTGRWILGSRLAGGLAAAFWALHPQTVWAATHNMSETAMTMVFFLTLGLARPWIDLHRREDGTARTIWRAGLLGLAIGWLTLAKAPFVYWALVLAILIAVRATGRRRHAPVAAFILTGLACAAADAIYRRWAFGAWGLNGYAYWYPPVYNEILSTFHWKYFWTPWSVTSPSGNLILYSKMILGLTNEFYSPFMGIAAIASLACLVWPWRRGRPGWILVGTMAGWGVVGFCFCGLYFYPSVRFPQLWIPLVDLLVAWGLVWVPFWRPFRQVRVVRWARLLALGVAVLLVRGEYRRISWNTDHSTVPYVKILRPMLKKVPKGAWLFTNYELPLVAQYRVKPGPTGALHSYLLDCGWMNVHLFTIDTFGLQPRRLRPEAREWLRKIPAAWENGPTELIGLDRAWRLTREERSQIFKRTAWLLVVSPPYSPATGRYFEQVILPLLKQDLHVVVEKKVELVLKKEIGSITLYRAEPRRPRPASPERQRIDSRKGTP